MSRLVRSVVIRWRVGLLLAVVSTLCHGLRTVPRFRPKVSPHRMRLAATILTACWSLPPAAFAEPIFFGPTPYLSADDSPFDLSGLGTTFFLEDFEDGELNTPGILLGTFHVRLPASQTDSVDADDGAIDGQGSEGHSVGSGGFCTDGEPPSCSAVVSFLFDENELGWLPTAVGLVWTDGSPDDSVTFVVFDSTFQAIAGFDVGPLGDDSFSGTTAEDRFIGVVDPAGIHGVSIGVHGIGGVALIEADHLQYGLFVPEPSTMELLVTFALFASRYMFVRRNKGLFDERVGKRRNRKKTANMMSS